MSKLHLFVETHIFTLDNELFIEFAEKVLKKPSMQKYLRKEVKNYESNRNS